MTKLAVPPGAGLHQAKQRLHGRGFWTPRLLTDGASGAASTRSAVAFTGGIAHTMGLWVEIVAALSEDVGFVRITPTASTNLAVTDTSALFNLGTGAALSESIVLDSLGVGWWLAAVGSQHPGWLFPIFIPKGTRVAGQVQGAEATKAFSARFEFFAPVHGLIPSKKVTALGAVTASSKGVTLTQAGSNNSEGAWTEIIATTTEPYTALGVSVQGGQDTIMGGGSGLVDVAVGASGSEVAVITDIGYTTTNAEAIQLFSPLVHPLPNGIPAGARISARYQATDRTNGLDVIVHGVRYAA